MTNQPQTAQIVSFPYSVRDDDTPRYDVGVYGGGKIFRGLATYAGVRRPKGAINIA